MKKILITRRLLRSCEDKAKETFDANLNLNDELYSQQKLIELCQGFDGILSSLTDKLDAETINKLPESIKIISNFSGSAGLAVILKNKNTLTFRFTIKNLFNAQYAVIRSFVMPERNYLIVLKYAFN